MKKPNLITFLTNLNAIDSFSEGIWMNPVDFNQYHVFPFDYNAICSPHLYDEYLRFGVAAVPESIDPRCPKDWVYIGSLNALSFAHQNDVLAVRTFLENNLHLLDEGEEVEELVNAWCDNELCPDFRQVVLKGITLIMQGWALAEATEFVNDALPELIVRSQAYKQHLLKQG